MFKTLKVKTKLSNYPIYIGKGICKKFLNDLKKNKSKKFILIDSIVYKKIKPLLNKIKDERIFVIQLIGSEKIKSIYSILIDFLFYFGIISFSLKTTSGPQ